MNCNSPEAILELAGHFMECRILLTGAELDLFTLLGHAPLSVEEIAAKTGTRMRPLAILLDALTAMGLLAKTEGKYRCPPLIASSLARGTPESILPVILHMASLWHRWSDLTPLLRGKAPERRSSRPGDEELADFIGAMDAIASRFARQIVAAIRPGQSRALLDVGGASGTYTLAFLQAVPDMKATLFDQPAVIEMARRRLGRQGILDRVNLVGGDFYRDDLPAGHDLAFLSAIIHQNSPEQNLDLFRKVYRALDPGGRVVIRDHVMNPDHTAPQQGAVFAVNMLLATSGGGTYSFDEIRAGLEQAGFVRVRLLKGGERMDALVEAFKPSD